jgi:hypothetical protein
MVLSGPLWRFLELGTHFFCGLRKMSSTPTFHVATSAADVANLRAVIRRAHTSAVFARCAQCRSESRR